MLLKQQHLISFSMRKDLYTRRVSACDVVHISANKYFPSARIQKNPNYKSTVLNFTTTIKRCASITWDCESNIGAGCLNKLDAWTKQWLKLLPLTVFLYWSKILQVINQCVGYVAYNFAPAPHNLRQCIIQQVAWLNSKFGNWYTNLQTVCNCECKARVTHTGFASGWRPDALQFRLLSEL